MALHVGVALYRDETRQTRVRPFLAPGDIVDFFKSQEMRNTREKYTRNIYKLSLYYCEHLYNENIFIF